LGALTRFIIFSPDFLDISFSAAEQRIEKLKTFPGRPRLRSSLEIRPCGERQQGKRDDPKRRIAHSRFLGHEPILS
jgi:hypothetical protein